MPTLVSRRAPRSPALSSRTVRGLADRMLRALDLAGAELSVLLTDDATIRELNREHREKDSATDVLAFPMDLEHGVGTAPTGARPAILGDVVISLDTADRQARRRGRPLRDEVRFLLAHGLLHLIGYDHATREEKREMDSMTRRLVEAASR